MKKKILLFGIICGLLTTAFPLETQAQNEIISYIYHKHLGTTETLGGCYEQPLYHVHKGDQISGGSCYEQIIYHQHSGTEKEGGGCYSLPVYHEHQGSKEAEGGCYVKEYHSHTSSCYKNETCTINTKSFSYCFNTWYEYCYHHGEAVHGEWYAVKSHSDCGEKDFDSTVKMCNSCRHPDVGEHTYKKLNCSRAKEVVGYKLGCNKKTTDIIAYALGCNKEEGTDIDGFELTCSKTATTVDAYELSCGKETTVPLGFVKITNLTKGKADTVVLEASYWDSAASEGRAGELKVGSTPFIWRDASSGKDIGKSERIAVKKNGSYTVTLQAENQDIKKEGLSVTILVSNIKTATGGGDDRDEDQGGGQPDDDHEQGGGEEDEGNTPVVTPSPSIVPAKPEVKPETPSSPKVLPDKQPEVKAAATASPVKVQAITKIETKEVKVPEADAEAEVIEIQELPVKTSFWQSPAGQALVITLGGAAAILGLIVLWLLLFRYVGIYGDDGEGNDCFLGFGLIRRDDPFLLVISEHTMDRADTSRYCLRPGILFYKLHEQSELLVEAKNKKFSLPIDREMKFKY